MLQEKRDFDRRDDALNNDNPVQIGVRGGLFFIFFRET